MKSWTDYGLRFFKSPRLFQMCFSIEDYQGDGFIKTTFGIFKRSIQITIPFNGNKLKYRCNWILFRKNVL